MKYQIRYQHRQWDSASSKSEACRKVRLEAGQRAMSWQWAPDGLYAWRSAADRRRDDTGARAFAVICKAEASL